ncbi:MAG TPA: hypothetical protein VGS60_14580 [Actinomycetes bacterium]|nr:hypothetical protein [Actinomycetes bacterium]
MADVARDSADRAADSSVDAGARLVQPYTAAARYQGQRLAL